MRYLAAGLVVRAQGMLSCTCCQGSVYVRVPELVGGVEVTRCRRRRGSAVINTAADFVISEMTDFAYQIDLTDEMWASRVDAITMSINPAFLMLLRRERRSITK